MSNELKTNIKLTFCPTGLTSERATRAHTATLQKTERVQTHTLLTDHHSCRVRRRVQSDERRPTVFLVCTV